MNVTRHRQVSWRAYLILSVVAIVGFTGLAAFTGRWVVTALPIGFLFGFFLQKGDLCGSSAFSEILVMRDGRKLWGLWVLIVVAALGFAFLNLLGWVQLNPKPFLYLNYVVGGVLFGTGMVLAGGCISGCLYKAAAGNLNSMVALLTIPVGVMVVEFGPLQSVHQAMKGFVVNTSQGEKLSLSAISGLPYWLWAVVLALLTLIGSFLLRGSHPAFASDSSSSRRSLQQIVTRPWKPWLAGLAIGLLMVPAYLSSAASGRNYPLGVTHGVMQAELLFIDQGFQHVYQIAPTKSSGPPSDLSKAPATSKQATGANRKIVWWLVLLVVAMIPGSWVSARLSGQAKLLRKPPDEILFALLGGLLIGIGAAFATGCVVGNIMSGWALMSIGMILFGIVTIMANWVATYFYMMGGELGR